jgi:PKD repeat protein
MNASHIASSCSLLLAGLAPWIATASPPLDCSLTTIGVAPLTDMDVEYRPGHMGGLWPFGTSARPNGHGAAGLAIVQGWVLPRDASGAVDMQNGKIGLISIGMSNTTQEFREFVDLANADPAKDSRVVVIDGAQGGQAADDWLDPNAQPWQVLANRIAAAGLSPAQVQVAWIKQAERRPNDLGAFPLHAQVLQSDLETIVQVLRAKYPHVRLTYLSSRTRAYTDDPQGLNPEPFAFESAFSVRWVLERQISGEPSLDFDPGSGPVPWLSWGPYLWADGEVPRSDDFIWSCTDTVADFTHPSATGRLKVAQQLVAFFKTDPTTTPWYLRQTIVGQPPVANAGADVVSGDAPLSVSFQANASDPDGVVAETAWTFDDGCFSLAPDPIKVFEVPGLYHVQLTVSDDDGNTTRVTLPISVSDGDDPTSAYCFCDAGAPCANTDANGGCANSSGQGAVLGGSGSASVSADDLFLTAIGAPSNQNGIFFMGGGASLVPFGDGQRCVANAGQGVFRYALSNSGPTGTFSLGPVVGASHARFSPPGRIQAGQTWFFQCWFRDPMGPCGRGFNLSNGVSLSFVP